MELRGEKGQEESQDSATDPESRMLGRLGTQQEAEETGQRGVEEDNPEVQPSAGVLSPEPKAPKQVPAAERS